MCSFSYYYVWKNAWNLLENMTFEETVAEVRPFSLS